jgi:hypothetical protein
LQILQFLGRQKETGIARDTKIKAKFTAPNRSVYASPPAGGPGSSLPRSFHCAPYSLFYTAQAVFLLRHLLSALVALPAEAMLRKALIRAASGL